MEQLEQQEPTEFILDVFADPRSVRDVVKGILHTIFFHRFFPALTPRTRDVLDLALPYVDDDELETMIDQRVAALERQLDAERSGAGAVGTTGATGGGRGQLAVQFFEKRRRKAWLSRGDDEVCWERWTVKVTVAEPKTESERAKVRRAMEQTLLTTVIKIVTFANSHKDHIPPITTQATNPFPYKINIDQKETSWASRMRIY
ncbi:autophagy-related protein 101 [Geosmithia morbida]|uniref:Autophagy-related protein 101 n=1 Tax=Geosmithia morbida TaxID=1094350 RepID=A0A9P5D1N9_9HYPO|nr:autophagy-related protein 101 [Geosmithia morbida]KAF4124128.1 autophagy-related protein 101 [Geosmithia morbida]